MLATGLVLQGMEKELNCGTMAHIILAIGKTIRPMEKADSFTRMGMCMKEIGKTIKPMDMEYILIWKVLYIKVTGKKTSRMEKAKKCGLMVLSTKEITKMGRSMA